MKVKIISIIILNILLLGAIAYSLILRNKSDDISCIELNQIYKKLTIDSILQERGSPYFISNIRITGDTMPFPWSVLQKYQKLPRDTSFFKQYLWVEKEQYLLLWLKQEDSTWIIVDGIQYNPYN